jgi:hypothetical protein
MRRGLLVIIGLSFLLLGIGLFADLNVKIKDDLGSRYYLEYHEEGERVIEGCMLEYDDCEE